MIRMGLDRSSRSPISAPMKVGIEWCGHTANDPIMLKKKRRGSFRRAVMNHREEAMAMPSPMLVKFNTRVMKYARAGLSGSVTESQR